MATNILRILKFIERVAGLRLMTLQKVSDALVCKEWVNVKLSMSISEHMIGSHWHVWCHVGIISGQMIFVQPHLCLVPCSHQGYQGRKIGSTEQQRQNLATAGQGACWRTSIRPSQVPQPISVRVCSMRACMHHNEESIADANVQLNDEGAASQARGVRQEHLKLNTLTSLLPVLTGC